MDFVSDLHLYFRGEKAESAAILLFSAALLVAAIVLFFYVRQPFTKGLGVILMLAALIGGTVGGTVLLRTDGQVTDLLSVYEADVQNFVAVEGKRMETVIKSFGYYRFMYGASVVAALLIFFLSGRATLQGVAVGLLVFAAIGFTIDHYAEERAVRYAERIQAMAGAE